MSLWVQKCFHFIFIVETIFIRFPLENILSIKNVFISPGFQKFLLWNVSEKRTQRVFFLSFVFCSSRKRVKRPCNLKCPNIFLVSHSSETSFLSTQISKVEKFHAFIVFLCLFSSIIISYFSVVFLSSSMSEWNFFNLFTLLLNLLNSFFNNKKNKIKSWKLFLSLSKN